jgi:HD-like signal output (HDOD) protein
MNDLLLNRIVRSPSLPPLPQVAVDVLNVGADGMHPSTANAKLAEVVSRDEQLTERLLRAVNSPFYAVEAYCNTIEEAIRAIGNRAVKVLAIGMSMIDSLVQSQHVPFPAAEYCRRTLFAASAARLCAKTVEPTQVEACFLAALLMDIGVLLLGDALGEEYARILEKAGDHANLESTERELLDLTHADVAGAVARHWKLPDVLQVPIAKHHDPRGIPAGALRALTEMACLAGQCADVFVGQDPGGSIADIKRVLRDRYGLGPGAVDDLLHEVGAAAHALSPAFGVEPDKQQTFEAAQARAAERRRAAGSAAHSGRERRRAQRLSRDGFLVIRPYLDGVLAGAIRVRFRDASATGIGFVHALPLAAGSQFVVELPGNRSKPRTILYTVVRCFPISEDEFHVGARMASAMGANNDGGSGGASKPASVRSRAGAERFNRAQRMDRSA